MLASISVRLLTEGFLRGNVSFSSTPVGGTVFTVALPLKSGARRSLKKTG